MNFYISNIGTWAGTLSLLAWIVYIVFKCFVQESMKSKFAKELQNLKDKNQKELEGFKAGYKKVLDENQIRFSKWHDVQADAIKELYKKLAEFSDALQCMVESCKFFSPGIDAEEQIRKEENRCMNAYKDSHRYYEENKLLLSEMHISKLDDLYQRAKSSMLYYESSIRKKANLESTHDDSKEAEELAKPIKAILDGLRKDFRSILNGEENKA